MDNFVCEYVGVLRKSKKAKENAEEHNPFVYVFNFGFVSVFMHCNEYSVNMLPAGFEYTFKFF